MAEMIRGREIRDSSLESRIMKSEMIIEIPEIRAPSLESLSNLGEELEKESLSPYAEKLGITEELEEKQQRLYAERENPYESYERILIEGLEEKREGIYGEISIPLLKTTIEKKMMSIPFTLRPIYAGQPRAYFYYFTDALFRREDSKYRLLDDSLSLLGRHREGIEVIMIDRDRIPSETWDAILRGLGIRKYPALIVSSHSLGIEKLEWVATEYNPPDVDFVKLERGIIADQILRDRDKLDEFLNELFDAAKEGITENTLRKTLILEALKMVGREVRDIIVKFV